MFRKGLSLSETLAAAAIAATIGTILVPAIPLASPGLRSDEIKICMGQARLLAGAAFAYAEDFNGVLPRLDNNGTCWYGENPCDTPDWGDFRFPSGRGVKEAIPVMFPGAIEPYHGDYRNGICPNLGPSSWKHAYALAAELGIVPPAMGYNPAHERYYYLAMGQFGVNILLVDFGPSLSATNRRIGAPLGRLAAVVHPGEIVMFAKESAWDWNYGVKLRVGDLGVWPSWPLNQQCWSSSAEGWTTYAHGGTPGYHILGDPNRVKSNPNLRGKAVFSFVDGHAATMRYPEAERCTQTPYGLPWRRGLTGNILHYFYYPHWVPEM